MFRCIPPREDLDPLSVFQYRAHRSTRPVKVLSGRSILGLYTEADPDVPREFDAWRVAVGRQCAKRFGIA
jgi:hypothetical protein